MLQNKGYQHDRRDHRLYRWRHVATTGGTTNGNANGHIIRLREAADTTEATSFIWYIYAFGAGADLDAGNVNLSGLDATNDFSSPDGLWFGRSSDPTGLVSPVLWIETDDGAYTDVTNCMLLAAMPGNVGDGGTKTITNSLSGSTGTPAPRRARQSGEHHLELAGEPSVGHRPGQPPALGDDRDHQE